MFFEPVPTLVGQSNEALAALLTFMLTAFLVFLFFHTKPTTQRAFLRLMLQPIYVSLLIFTTWLCAMLLSHFLVNLVS
jgi:hypothetical protein